MTHLIIVDSIVGTNSQIGTTTSRIIKVDWKIMLLYIQHFGKKQTSLGTTSKEPIPCISFVSLRKNNETELANTAHKFY